MRIKHKYFSSCVIAFIVTIAFQCSDESVNYPRQSFLGDWRISEVIYDGTLQPQWNGATLTFTQATMDSGTYYLPETPYDSIWNSIGYWKTLNEDNVFYREDDIEVQYWFKENESKMMMNLYLPWTQQSTCVDSICLPVVTGQWIFELKK